MKRRMIFTITMAACLLLSACKNNDVLSPSSSNTDSFSEKPSSEQLAQLPYVQEAYKQWVSFGGHPPFSTPEKLTANDAAELYVNYCESNEIETVFVQDAEDIKTGVKWIPAADLEQFISGNFGIEPGQIRRDSFYYNAEKGYLYPIPMAVRADEYRLLSIEDVGDSRLQMKIEYIYKLPPELYDSETTERKTVFTVMFSVENNNPLFYQALFENVS